MRSRAAASMLRTAGFKNAVSMAGGIKAWNGLVAAGVPEAGMSFFPVDADTQTLIALAWTLEEGSRKFYAAVAGMPGTGNAKEVFSHLVTAEEHHKEALLGLYRDTTGREAGPDFPGELLQPDGKDDRMEGNMKVSEALSWAEGKQTREILELSMALETDSYDLYIKMGRRMTEAIARKLFDRLVAEEKQHLERMADLLDRDLGA
jgi:rubrerythrin